MEESQEKSHTNGSDDTSLNKNNEHSLHFVGSRSEQRWETLFEPHFTFNKTSKYLDPMVAREKGSERQASMILQQKSQQQRRSSQFQLTPSASTLSVVMEERPSSSSYAIEDELETTSLNSFSVASSPTLPRMEDLMLPVMDQPNQISILPCPSQSLDDLQNARSRPLYKMDEWKERLDLLNSIHEGPGRHRISIGDQINNEREKKNDDDRHPDEEIIQTTKVAQKESFSLPWWRRSVGQVRKCHPHRTFRAKMDQLKKEAELPFFTTQLILQQEREKRKKESNLSESPLTIPVCEEDIIEIPSFFKKYRPSFLFFIFGFIFPPIWIVGALYMKRSEDMAKADYQWKRRSRNALTFFLSIILLSIILILIINPSALGWRQSSSHL
ncbi:hypothetical protein BCR42DRAFT_390017 [Absidia repens]|uniref:Uncharacterized protein n=1 Tax=Absidia repens TaxID=90262 RepID=A0A1X2IMT7_9FUNG|nr:hypothetical protein BCR42DRAFT_390017 [Absidia repens]